MCPEDWINYGDFCYQLNNHPEQKTSWIAAESACRSFPGAHLVSITNPSEQTMLTTQFRDTGSQQFGSYFWIGLTDKDSEGRFVWPDKNQKITYKNWGIGQEQHNSKTKNCVRSSISTISGNWSIANCNEENYYVCKRKRGKT